MGYRIGWAPLNYDMNMSGYNSFIPYTNIDGFRAYIKKYQSEYDRTDTNPITYFDLSIGELEWIEQEYPNDTYPKDKFVFFDLSNCAGLDPNVDLFSAVPYSNTVNLDGLVSCYQLFDNVVLDLSYGKMPEALNEVVVSQNLAEIIQRNSGISSIENLIGKEVHIAIDRQLFLDSDNRLAHKTCPIIISGITYMESKYENQVFFMDNGLEKLYIEEFNYKPEIVTYQYLHFLTDPSYDSEKIANDLNQVLNSQDSRFEVYLASERASENYQKPTNILIFASFGLLTLITLYLMMHFLLNKRMTKENKIMTRYKYHPLAIHIMIMMILMVLVAIPQLAILSYVCEWLNHFANSIGMANIVEYNISNYMYSFTITATCVILLEGGIYAIRTKKHS